MPLSIKSVEMLKDEHRKVEAKLRELRSRISEGRNALDLLAEVENELKKHIYFEEELLFPSFRDEEERRIAVGLEYEHAAILTLVDRIRKGINESNRAFALKKTESTIRLFSHHSKREELTAYRFRIDGNATSDLDAENLASDSVPADWKCRFFRRRQ
jgi:hypothetical protein